MKMNTSDTNEIVDAINSKVDKAYKDGLYAGYLVAQRIALWYAANYKLLKPESNETLEKWANDALAELEAKYKG